MMTTSCLMRAIPFGSVSVATMSQSAASVVQPPGGRGRETNRFGVERCGVQDAGRSRHSLLPPPRLHHSAAVPLHATALTGRECHRRQRREDVLQPRVRQYYSRAAAAQFCLCSLRLLLLLLSLMVTKMTQGVLLEQRWPPP